MCAVGTAKIDNDNKTENKKSILKPSIGFFILMLSSSGFTSCYKSCKYNMHRLTETNRSLPGLFGQGNCTNFKGVEDGFDA